MAIAQPSVDLLPILSGTAEPASALVVTATDSDGSSRPFPVVADGDGTWRLIPELPVAGDWAFTVGRAANGTGGSASSLPSEPVSVSIAQDDLTVHIPSGRHAGSAERLYCITGTAARDLAVRHADGSEATLTLPADGRLSLRGPADPADPAALVSIAYSGGGTHGIARDLRSFLAE